MPGWEAGESGSTGLPYPYKSVVPTGTESQGTKAQTKHKQSTVATKMVDTKF